MHPKSVAAALPLLRAPASQEEGIEQIENNLTFAARKRGLPSLNYERHQLAASEHFENMKAPERRQFIIRFIRENIRNQSRLYYPFCGPLLLNKKALKSPRIM